jgi:hypothetical protein
MSLRIQMLALAVLVSCPTAAWGQDAMIVWRIGAGYESSWIRDVARSGPPADASPVRRAGHGPALDVQYDRSSLKRLHRFHLSAGWTGGFVYETPTLTQVRPSGEHGFHAGGGYEYRRYFFRDLGFDGLDLGMGVDGGAVLQRATFVWEPAIEAWRSATEFNGGGVVAGRLRRWRAWQLEVIWVNGVTLLRTTSRHSTAADPETGSSGGGWFTDLSAQADVRISRTVNVFVKALTTGRGHYESHATSMLGGKQFIVGVAYAR